MRVVERFLNSLRNNLKEAPFAIISDYILASILLYLVFEGNKDISSYIYKLIPTLILAYFLFTALHTLKRKLYLILGVVAVALYYAFYAPIFSSNYFTAQAVYLIIASILSIFVAPFIGKKEVDNLDIFNWVSWVGYSLSSSILLSLLITAAMSFAFGAIELLLGFKIDGDYYTVVTIITFGVFGGNYFLEQLRGYKPNQESFFNRLQPLLAKYFLPTFAIFYLTILYIYTAKIVINYTWPKGGVAWFILFFTLIVFIAHFHLIPFKKEKLQKLFLVAVIPQAFILILAVYERVEAYSFTESRFMLILYGIFLIFISLYFLLKRDATYKAFFITAILLLIFSQVGFTSGFYISKVAQTKKLEANLKLLKENNNSKELKKDISSSLRYLIKRYGINGVKDVLPEIVEKYKSKGLPLFNKHSYKADIEHFIAKELGFKYSGDGSYYGYSDDKWRSKRINCSNKKSLTVKGYDYLISDYTSFSLKEKSYKLEELEEVEVSVGESELLIKNRERTTKIDLKPYMKKLFDANSCIDDGVFEYEDESVKLKLIPTSAFELSKDKISFLTFSLLLKFKW